MTDDELKALFRGKAVMKDEKGKPYGRGIRKTELLENGFTKRELEQLVLSGKLEKASSRDPKFQKKYKVGPIITVYVLKGVE